MSCSEFGGSIRKLICGDAFLWKLYLAGLFVLGMPAINLKAENIANYMAKPPHSFVYKARNVLDLGYMNLEPKQKNTSASISDHTIDINKAVKKDGYWEILYSREWKEEGFSYKAATRLYPRKIVHVIDYGFARQWEGQLNINPWIDPVFVTGAKYKAVDVDDLASEGVVAGLTNKYVLIPKWAPIKKMRLEPKEGGGITFKLEHKNPLREDQSKNIWAGNGLFLDLLKPDGSLRDARFKIGQLPPKMIFPAGYTNEIRLEIEFEQDEGLENKSGKNSLPEKQ